MQTYSTRGEALRAEQRRLEIAAIEQQRLHEEAERRAREQQAAERAEAARLAQHIVAWGAANGYPSRKFSAWQTLLGGEANWRKVLGWENVGDARRLSAHLGLDARTTTEPEPLPDGIADEVAAEELAEHITQRSGGLLRLAGVRRA